MPEKVVGDCTECGSPILTRATPTTDRVPDGAEPKRTCPPECRFSPEAYQLFTYRNGEIHAGKTVRSRNEALRHVRRSITDVDAVLGDPRGTGFIPEGDMPSPKIEEFQFYLPTDETPDEEEDHA